MALCGHDSSRSGRGRAFLGRRVSSQNRKARIPVRADTRWSYAHAHIRAGVKHLSNSYELFLLVVVLVGSIVVLRLVFAESNKIKFNLNFNSDLAAHYGLRDLVAGKTVRLQFTGRCLTHKINPDWGRMIVNDIGTRKLPLSFEISGCQITCIVDGCSDDVPSDVRPLGMVGLQADCASASDLTFCQLYVKVMRFPQEGNLITPSAIRNVGVQQRSDNSHCEPKSIA
jgi:hypothetical protein